MCVCMRVCVSVACVNVSQCLRALARALVCVCVCVCRVSQGRPADVHVWVQALIREDDVCAGFMGE